MGEDQSTYYFGNEPKDNNYYSRLPPYNRKTGRSGERDPNCLHQYKLQDYRVFGQNTCAQDIPNNDFHDPKIRLRTVICTGVCWNMSFDLKGVEGECGMFMTPEIINAKRICARIASPAGDDGTEADHGYFQEEYLDANKQPILDNDGKVQYRGKHLDIYGVKNDDKLYTDDDGNSYPILRPKICAYDDPWALDLWTLLPYGQLDFFDLDPTHQPFHKGSGEVSPIVKIIIFILQSATNLYSMQMDVISMIVSAITSLFNKDEPSNPLDKSQDKGALATYYKIIGLIVEALADIAIKILEHIGQVNKLATAPYGCINIPLGPYPPRYCQASEMSSRPVIEEICTSNSDGQVIQSCHLPTLSQQEPDKCSPRACILSPVDNNFIHNAIRIGYQTRIPLCHNALSAECIAFHPEISVTRGAVMNNAIDPNKVKNNLISGSALTLLSASGLKIKPEKYYRILYETKTQKDNSAVSIDNYSYIDLPSCSDVDSYTVPSGMGSKQFCQQIWGVDLGDFSDDFIANYSGDNLNNKSASSSIISLGYGSNLEKDKKIQTRLYARISNDDTPEQICAYFADNSLADKISCVPRAPAPLQNVSECSTSTHMSPCIKINLTAKGQNNATYSVSSEMRTTPFRQDYQGENTTSTVIAGIMFDGYVTDDQNSVNPFYFSSNNDIHALKTADNIIVHNSLFGNYKNNKVPSPKCSMDTCAKYLSGLEYIMGNYVRGGTQICIKPSQEHQCPNDVTQCVSAKKIPMLDKDNKIVTNSDGRTIYIGVSTKPEDRITPPFGQDGYYNPEDADGTNCLKNKIKSKKQYAQISPCLPDCNANSKVTKCVRKFNLVDSTCSPAININSYLSSDVVSNKTSSAAISNRSFLESGNNINLNITIDPAGNLIYTKTSSKDDAKLILVAKTSVNFNNINNNVTIINIVTNANKIDQMATTTTIDTENSIASSSDAINIPKGKNPPLIPNNKGKISNNKGVISVTNDTKVIKSDPDTLKISLTDSAKEKVVIEAFIDIDTGLVNINHITTDLDTKISSNKILIFDPSTGKHTSSLEVKDSAKGSEYKTVVSPIDGTITKVEKTLLTQGNVTTATTITTITNPTTLASTTVQSQDITTIKDGIETKVNIVTDAEGNVTKSQPKESSIANYYCYQQNNLNNKLRPEQGVRSKVGNENRNNCIPVPTAPKCPAIKDVARKASWPEAEPGQDWIQGKCNEGYLAQDPNKMGRQCIFFLDGASKYDSIDLKEFASCRRATCGMYNLVMSATKNGHSNDNPSFITNGACPKNKCDNKIKFGFTVADVLTSIMSEDMITNKFTIKLHLQYMLTSLSSVIFKSVVYTDDMIIKVGGEQINKDNPLKILEQLIPSSITNIAKSVTPSIPDLIALNLNLAAKLKEGQNIIEIELKSWKGVKMHVEMEYNSLLCK